jgi:hypothetical protein
MAKVVKDKDERPLVLHSHVRMPLSGLSFLHRALLRRGLDARDAEDLVVPHRENDVA